MCYRIIRNSPKTAKKHIKKIVYLLFLLLIKSLEVDAQDNSTYSKKTLNFPVSIALQFQNFSLPVKDLKSHFGHPGVLIGSEIALNKRKTLIQQVNLSGYLNKEMGDGFTVYTQTAYRPHIFKQLYAEAKLGVGWLRSYHPVEAYKYTDGEWVKTPGGKSQLIIPFGVGFEYHKLSTKPSITPYLSYQITPNLFYNDVIPLSFYSFIQAGVRINFEY